jgi:hypothetical protein
MRGRLTAPIVTSRKTISTCSRRESSTSPLPATRSRSQETGTAGAPPREVYAAPGAAYVAKAATGRQVPCPGDRSICGYLCPCSPTLSRPLAQRVGSRRVWTPTTHTHHRLRHGACGLGRRKIVLMGASMDGQMRTGRSYSVAVVLAGTYARMDRWSRRESRRLEITDAAERDPTRDRAQLCDRLRQQRGVYCPERGSGKRRMRWQM